MTELPSITRTLLAAKKAKHLSFESLEPIVGCDEVWIAALFYRQATATKEQACALLEALGLDDSFVDELTTYPVKGLGPIVPTDPLIYRFYEIIQVYGLPLKDVIQEKFGEGIVVQGLEATEAGVHFVTEGEVGGVVVAGAVLDGVPERLDLVEVGRVGW